MGSVCARVLLCVGSVSVCALLCVPVSVCLCVPSPLHVAVCMHLQYPQCLSVSRDPMSQTPAGLVLAAIPSGSQGCFLFTAPGPSLEKHPQRPAQCTG